MWRIGIRVFSMCVSCVVIRVVSCDNGGRYFCIVCCDNDCVYLCNVCLNTGCEYFCIMCWDTICGLR